MADRPTLHLEFTPQACPDCGQRSAVMPGLPVPVADDFDWTARDFEGFRQFMLEDLGAADPERQRWTEADMELVIVEVLAAGLDRASHSLDSVFAERFPQTARLPQSLVSLLKVIDGVDSAWSAVKAQLVDEELELYGFADSATQLSQTDGLLRVLTARPQLMAVAKAAGLSKLDEIVSFLTPTDLQRFLLKCPLVSQVHVRFKSQGGLGTYEIVTLFVDTDLRFHDLVSEISEAQSAFKEFFFAERDRSIPPEQSLHPLKLFDEPMLDETSIRTALTRLVEPLLPVCSKVSFVDGTRVGIFVRLCVHVASNYFRSEVELAVRHKLSTEVGQFFDPLNFGFGQELFLSDIQEALMSLPGVEGVVFNRFQIVGRPETDSTSTGVLAPQKHEALTLDINNPGAETGYVVLKLVGGQLG